MINQKFYLEARVGIGLSGQGVTGKGGSLDPVYFNVPFQFTIADAEGLIPVLSLATVDDTNFVAAEGNGFIIDLEDNTATLNTVEINELEAGL
jgi:hypothetical protein